MDAVELFKRLGAGAKFDFKRFGSDAERFKVMSGYISALFFLCSSRIYASAGILQLVLLAYSFSHG